MTHFTHCRSLPLVLSVTTLPPVHETSPSFPSCYALNLLRNVQVDCFLVLSNTAFALYYIVYVQFGLSFLSFA
jgi:hypothetical protein